MDKVGKKELEQLKRQSQIVAPRGDTFVGCRPTTFIPKHLRRANDRQEAKRICREYC